LVRHNGDEDRPLFAFPGIWTRYRGPLKKNGENVDQEVFAFMTTEPNELTASINHERMPALMSNRADFETWLSGSTEDAFKLARSYAANQMRIVQFGAERHYAMRSRDVRNVRRCPLIPMWATGSKRVVLWRA
jgi:putative SOS response-associated peptidase YedK